MKQVIAAISGLAIGSALLAAYFLTPTGGVGGGTGTLNQLQQWKYDGTYLTQVVTNRVLKLTGLESAGDCLKTDASGVVTVSACGGGGGSSKWTDAGAYVYPLQGDYISAPRLVATSTTASSTFAAGVQIDGNTRLKTTLTGIIQSVSGLLSATTTGALSESVTGLELSASRALIGGSAALSLTSGYNIPLTASTTAWNNFLVVPSGVITAGDALTWSTNTLNFDGGATPSGDLGGTWATPSVTDDSHAHTGSTISGVDISADTNLTAGDALTLTDDDIDFDGGASPAGELGGTWASPTIDDSLAVSSWNLTTPTITTSLTLGADTIDDFSGFGMAVATGDLGLLTTGAIDGECLVYESTGTTIDWVSCGGGVAWDTISDAAANGSIGMAEYTQTMDWDTGAVTSIAADYLSITSQNDAATDISTQRLLVLENKAASTNAMEVMQRITNSDAVAVVTGLLIDGAGAFTTAIDVSAAAIGTALAIGSNDITVGGVTLSSTEMSYLDGVTSAIQTQLAALGAIAGQVWTGVHDFGGATSLEIVNGASPTVDTLGEIALDTTDNQFLVATGTAARAIPTITKLWGGTVASTSVDFVSGGRIPLPPHRDGVMITEVHCYVDGGTSKVINIDTVAGGAQLDSLTCATTLTSDTAQSANYSLAAGALQALEFGATTGTVDYVTFSVWGYIKPE